MTVLLRHVVWVGGWCRYPEALEYLRGMRDDAEEGEGVPPDLVCYNKAMLACSQGGLPHQARALMHDMKQQVRQQQPGQGRASHRWP